LTININIHVHDCRDQHERREANLWANIGPFTEQETSALNPAVTLTDSQQYQAGPFNAVDKKGVVIGPAVNVSASSGDTNVVTTIDNGDGTFNVVAGQPGQAQATFSDGTSNPFVIDNTVIAGAEASISASIGAPTDQP